MAGAGVEVRYDKGQFRAIREALEKASMPDLEAIARFMGAELDVISKQAFEQERDPVTGKKWEKLKFPPETNRPILNAGGQLKRSLIHEDHSDGTVLYGTNVVYGHIHQDGGKTGSHEIRPVRKKALRFGTHIVKRVRHPGSDVSQRRYMGPTGDFDRRILGDPAIIKLLGMAGGTA